MNEWCTMWLLPYADHFNTQAFSFPWTTHNTLLGCHQPNLGKNLNCHLKRSATIPLILYTLTSRCSAWAWSIKIVCTPCCSSMQQHGGLSLPGGCSKQSPIISHVKGSHIWDHSSQLHRFTTQPYYAGEGRDESTCRRWTYSMVMSDWPSDRVVIQPQLNMQCDSLGPTVLELVSFHILNFDLMT